MISTQVLRQASVRGEVPGGKKVPGKQRMQKSWGRIGPGPCKNTEEA